MLCFQEFVTKIVELPEEETRHIPRFDMQEAVDVSHFLMFFFWSSGIMECTCMLFTFENGVPLMR